MRGGDTWDDFLKRHAASLWSCDFFTKHVWTLRGWAEIYVLFFLNVETRQVHVAGQEVKPAALLRDNDRKYGPAFDAVFAAEGVRVKLISPASANLNARAERWVQTVEQELLSRFIVFGEAHLRYLLAEVLSHYHEARPHQALGNAPPRGPRCPAEGPPPTPDEVVCDVRLGGLLKHYRRAAA